MATLGPLNSRRPSGVCSMDPHMSKASGGHLWYSTLVCAAWQNLTASTVLAKVSMHRPCSTRHTPLPSIQPLFPISKLAISIASYWAEPDCIHYLGKGQHAPPLQHNKHSLILRAARYNAWLLIKLTPKEGFLAPASFLFFSFLFFSFLFFSFLFLSCLFLSFLVFSFLFFSFLPYPQLSHCFPDLTGLSVLLGRSSFAFVQQYKDLEESKAVVSFAPVTKHVCSVAGDLCCGALQEACNMISSVLQVLILADTATQTFCKRMHTNAHKSLVAYTVPREVSHHKLLEILCLSMRNMDYGKHCL